MTSSIEADNRKILNLASIFLNEAADEISLAAVDEIAQCGVSREYAFAVLLAAAFGLDVLNDPGERAFFDAYFPPMIHRLDPEAYRNDPYYRNISVPVATAGKCELKHKTYKPCEAFVCNDFERTPDGRVIPQIGFFDRAFSYPAIFEDGRTWMVVVPNEIETMKAPIAEARGNVLTYGLGLGYYAYCVSEKEDVTGVTVVEQNEDVIALFKAHLLPQFPHGGKIRIVHADAFAYAEKEMAAGRYDFVFTDLWHDVSDGLDLYLRMKPFEKASPHSVFNYWIERSIRCYL